MLSNEVLSKVLEAARNQELEELEQETAAVTYTNRFERRMKSLMSRRQKPYFSIIKTLPRRIAVVILVIMIAGMTTVMSVEALRSEFFRMIFTVYEKFSVVTYEQIESVPETEFIPCRLDLPAEYKQVSDFLVPENQYHRTIYKSIDGKKISFAQSSLNDTVHYLNTEGIVPEQLNVDGVEITYYENIGARTMLWNDAYHSYLIISRGLSRDEHLALLKKVVKK